eukprot:m.98739 g.98739  ORF g.98739 m.98739 type:complete len:655 (-) comp13645_c2_seq1:2039-4003(-)
MSGASKVLGGLVRRATLSLGGGATDRRNSIGQQAPRDASAESESSESAPLLIDDNRIPQRSDSEETTVQNQNSISSEAEVGTPVANMPPDSGRKKGRHVRSISQQVELDSLDLQQHSPTNSDEQDSNESNESDFSDDEKSKLPQKEGPISKWTNYLHGWQDRFLVLKEGTLSYFKSKRERKICRANINIFEAEVSKHEFDPHRFDIRIGDQAFYLRASTPSEREAWVNAIWNTQESDGNELKRCGSLTSLISTTSLGSNGPRSIQDKVAEVRSYHQMAAEQLDRLLEIVNAKSNDRKDAEVGSLDARGTQRSQEQHDNVLRREILAFKGTATGVLASLEEFVVLVQRREESWKKRMQKSQDKRARLEELYKAASIVSHEQQLMHGPDMQEGPNSLLTEEQWFDALEETLEGPGEEEEVKTEIKDASIQAQWKKRVQEEIQYVKRMQKQDMDSWEVVSQDGDIKVSRLQVELDGGNVMECIRTEDEFHGLTSREIVEYFTNQRYRRDWETVVEKVNVLEKLDHATQVVYSKYKRVWPSAARDLVNVTHYRHLSQDTWIAVTKSVEHPQYERDTNNTVRLEAKAHVYAKTEYKPGYDKSPDRAHISSKIFYFAEVNPGGWAPKSIVKAVSIKEFPKALRALRKMATEHYKDMAIKL